MDLNNYSFAFQNIFEKLLNVKYCKISNDKILIIFTEFSHNIQ